MFFLLYKHADDTVFDDFPMISDHFPKIAKDFPKLFSRSDAHFRAFSEHLRRLPNSAENCQRRPNTARKIAFTARQMCGQRFCKGLICTLLTIFDAHQRSSLNAPLPPRSKAVKAVFTHL